MVKVFLVVTLFASSLIAKNCKEEVAKILASSKQHISEIQYDFINESQLTRFRNGMQDRVAKMYFKAGNNSGYGRIQGFLARENKLVQPIGYIYWADIPYKNFWAYFDMMGRLLYTKELDVYNEVSEEKWYCETKSNHKGSLLETGKGSLIMDCRETAKFFAGRIDFEAGWSSRRHSMKNFSEISPMTATSALADERMMLDPVQKTALILIKSLLGDRYNYIERLKMVSYIFVPYSQQNKRKQKLAIVVQAKALKVWAGEYRFLFTPKGDLVSWKWFAEKNLEVLVCGKS